MTESLDQEVQAIREVLKALSPLSDKARASVLEYVVRRLDLPSAQALQGAGSASASAAVPPSTISGSGPRATPPTDIKVFREQKNPRSANEMAAVVAYYLANLAPVGQRKGTINQRDVETHFKIADFPLPKQVRATLPNAKAAGYFDSTGDGEYRLNAVGHNLVAHAMPRGKASDSGKAGRRRRSQKRRVVGKRRRRSAS
jgi:hypothetical protein